jgi:uncharacterized protein (TIGR03086 family)
MTEISQRYARLADAFAAKVAAVPADRWSAPTPCENWTARELVGHVVSTQGMFLGFVGRSIGDVPSVDGDPLAAWNTVRSAVQRDLEDPEKAGAEFEGMMGKQTFEGAVDRFLSFDLIVHGWDLARATGLDERSRPKTSNGRRRRPRDSATRCAARRPSARSSSRRPAPMRRPACSRSSAAAPNPRGYLRQRQVGNG